MALEKSISKAAKEFNDLPIDSTIEGIKEAAYLDRLTKEAELEMAKQSNKAEQKEEPIITAQDIENEMYR